MKGLAACLLCVASAARRWVALPALRYRGGSQIAAPAPDDDDSCDAAVDWAGLRSFARDASLVYCDATVIIAAHERVRYRTAAVDVDWASNSSAAALWRGTPYGDAAVVVRELPAVGMRYFVRTEMDADGRCRQRIVIKGSDNVQNFRDDVDYAKVGCTICHVRFHRGFLRVANAIWDDVEPLLRKDASIELTGHSLGGGAATVLAMRLARLGYSVSGVVSFGAPKVTNAHGCRLFAAAVPLVRVLTADDPVPMLPSMDAMTHTFGFYRHFGTRVVLLEDDDVDDNDHHDDDDDDDSRTENDDAEMDDDARMVLVELAPIDASGEPRVRLARVGRGRYATRPDSLRAAAMRRRPVNSLQSLRDAVRDFALHQLDESFLLHAHHVSPFAHSMDAYEVQVTTRERRATSLPPHMCRRRERPMQALKKRVPFLGLAAVASRYAWKWRKWVGIARPKYVLMSLLFVGWTGGWHALTGSHPVNADEGRDDGLS
ncbi:Alpha/Beta hydrolase protein [Pelagophyceae sp. CCMP2097]|nr:Alpha/Beta hydrolase protein [Pelagophyceae sp. CCMP2097]